MKINSRKLLLFLYQPEGKFWANYDQLEYLMHNLSETGLRSLISLLVKQGHLVHDSIQGRSSFALSSNGHQLCQQLFLGLEPVKPEKLYLVVILSTPSLKDSKRALQAFLTKNSFIKLSASIYITPRTPEASFVSECRLKHGQNLLLTELQNYIIGEPSIVIERLFGTADLQKSYSGISKEMDILIGKKIRFSLSNHQSNLKIFSVFNRMFETLQSDQGLLNSLQSHPISGAELCIKLHQFFEPETTEASS